MNPSQEPAQPQRPEQSFADPTAEPVAESPTPASGPIGGGSSTPASGPIGGGSPTPASGPIGGGSPTPASAPAGGGPSDPAPASDWAPGGDARPGIDFADRAGEPGYGPAHATGPVEGTAGFGPAHPTGPGFDPAMGGYPGEQPSVPAPAVRRPVRRTLLVAVLSGLAVVVLGGPLGLLWHALAPRVPVLDTGQNGIVVNDPSPEQYIAADGWYTLLGLGFGLLVAVVAWLVLRRDRGPFMLLGVVLGTLGAGYLVGPWIGGLIGKAGYHHWQQTAATGATYFAPPQIHSIGPKLVPAFAAAIVLTLLAGWSNDPELDRPGAKPGYTAPDPVNAAPTPADAPADGRF